MVSKMNTTRLRPKSEKPAETLARLAKTDSEQPNQSLKSVMAAARASRRKVPISLAGLNRKGV